MRIAVDEVVFADNCVVAGSRMVADRMAEEAFADNSVAAGGRMVADRLEEGAFAAEPASLKEYRKSLKSCSHKELWRRN